MIEFRNRTNIRTVEIRGTRNDLEKLYGLLTRMESLMEEVDMQILQDRESVEAKYELIGSLNFDLRKALELSRSVYAVDREEMDPERILYLKTMMNILENGELDDYDRCMRTGEPFRPAIPLDEDILARETAEIVAASRTADIVLGVDVDWAWFTWLLLELGALADRFYPELPELVEGPAWIRPSLLADLLRMKSFVADGWAFISNQFHETWFADLVCTIQENGLHETWLYYYAFYLDEVLLRQKMKPETALEFWKMIVWRLAGEPDGWASRMKALRQYLKAAGVSYKTANQFFSMMNRRRFNSREEIDEWLEKLAAK